MQVLPNDMFGEAIDTVDMYAGEYEGAMGIKVILSFLSSSSEFLTPLLRST